MEKIIYKGKKYRAVIARWSNGEITASIKICRRWILLYWESAQNGDNFGKWVKK